MTREWGNARRRVIFYTAIGLPLVASFYYILIVATDWARLSSLEVATANLLRFVPPNVAVIPDLIGPTIDTMLMAFFATVIIGIVAPPVAWLAARNISPNTVTYVIGRGIIVISRSVHELVWALFFVIAVGLGPLAGILALGLRGIGFVSKVTAEETEAIDVRPIEALRATGASPLNVVILSVIPQILPIYLGALIFQWEIDLRRAAVLGVVGAGGLGLAFHQAMMQFEWRDATAIVVVLVVVVVAGEFLSRQLRKRII